MLLYYLIILNLNLYIINCADEIRDNQSCLSQTNGYFWNGQQCLQCASPKCQCDTYQGCTGCVDMYYLKNNACLRCPKGCVECCSLEEQTEVICTLCDENYYNLKGVCYYVEGCNRVTQHGRCESCVDGYYLDNVCHECPTGCSLCDTQYYCTECYEGYYLKIENNYYVCFSCQPELDTPTCQACDADLKCLSCIDTYYYEKDSAQCLACQNNCKSCQNPKIKPPVCYACLDDFILSSDSSECLSCSDQISDCLWCSKQLDEGLESYQCGECQNGYYLEDGECKSCQDIDANIRRCNSATEITQCYPGYLLVEDGDTYKCVQNVNDCKKVQSITAECSECKDPKILNANSRCVECGEQIANCLVCDDSDGTIKCSECQDKYYNSGSSCSQCIPNCDECDSTSCTNCSLGYFYSNGSCVDCGIENCAKCGEVGNCAKCVDSYGIVEGQCQSCLQGCRTCNGNRFDCQECLDYYYLYEGGCLKYPPNCLKANLEGQCYLCQTIVYYEQVDQFQDENTANDSAIVSQTTNSSEKLSVFYISRNGYCAVCSDYNTGSFDCPEQCFQAQEQFESILVVGIIFIILQ